MTPTQTAKQRNVPCIGIMGTLFGHDFYYTETTKHGYKVRCKRCWLQQERVTE